MRYSREIISRLLFLLVTAGFLHLHAYGEIIINSDTNYPTSTTISERLTINATLIAGQDLIFSNNAELVINPGGVVIVYGNLITSNKITLTIGSYLIVKGSLTHSGSSGNISATVSDNAHVYIFGSFSSDFNYTDLGCLSGNYNHGTDDECGHGNLADFAEDIDEIPEDIKISLGCTTDHSPVWQGSYGLPYTSSGATQVGGTITLNAQAQPSPGWSYGPVTYSWKGPEDFSLSTTNTSLTIANASLEMTGYYTCVAMNTLGCYITDSTYVLVTGCGLSDSRYFSQDNYTGYWDDPNTWGTKGHSILLPPPSSPPFNFNLSIHGFVTKEGSLDVSGGGIYVCDTLVVTGNLHMTSNSITVGPNGVLIVLGNFTSGSGSLVNNEGGRIIFAGDFQQNQSYSFTDYGDIYIFSEPATTYGFVPKGLTEFELNEKDSPLFDFYCSLIDGGCQPEADVTPPSIACPANASYGCVKDLPQGAVPKNVSYSEFVGWGGSASDNQTLSEALTITYEDVTDPGVNCKVIRTYIVTDAANNSATCQQVFTITDTEKPTITCDYLENFSPNNDDCTATLTIDEPTVTDGCRYGDEHAHFSYRLANQGDEVRGEGSITATFPLGTTTITWTYADECGNSASCEQNIVVVFPLSPIFYDDDKTEADHGPGMNPMLTSTHSYFVDNKTPQAGYSYDWKLYENDGGNPGVVVSSGYTVTTPDIDNPSFVSITFLDGLATGNYLLSLTKIKNATCEKQELLPLTIQANTFDAQLQAGSECQAGETDVPTTVSWGVSFPGSGIEPYQFDFNIILTNENGNSFPVCQGSVGNITLNGITGDLSISSSCGDMGSLPYLEVIKSSGNYQVSVSYTVSSITASDFDVDISIDASDQFSVSDIQSNNNSKTIKLWGIPDTSDIETD